MIKALLSSLQAIFVDHVFSLFSRKPKKEELQDNITSVKIVIDPGHGGRRGRRDPGAIGKIDSEEIYERDVVLEICKHLAFKLDSRGFKVVLTRIDNDPNARSTLGAKVRIAKAESPDLFISVHANSNSGRPAQGIETYYDRSSLESKEFAKSIQNTLMEFFPGHRDRGIKDGSSLYVLSNVPTESKCLVECEFINHHEQVKFLTEESEQIAESLAEGVIRYVNSLTS
jgi:N-acetylmuramoyl-L-alanine amidase